MKLRNKTTSKIYELNDDLFIEYTTSGRIGVRMIFDEGNITYFYDSLAKLNEEWEDYKPSEPSEPLIKDEEVRTMIRLWAKHHNSSKLLYLKLDGQDGHYLLDRKSLRSVDVDIDTLKIHDVYTITELCGEEETCEK